MAKSRMISILIGSSLVYFLCPFAVFSAVIQNNVLAVSLAHSSLCNQGKFFNQLCTTITVCTPGTSECQEVSDVLVDTGSVGVRLFHSALKLRLPQVNQDGLSLAECAQFGSGSDWGPIVESEVRMGGESTGVMRIQIINAHFLDRPRNCLNSDVSPKEVGLNGILGVGLFREDCGFGCAEIGSNLIYYGCNHEHCKPLSVSNELQLQNPISLFMKNNNGMILDLANVTRSHREGSLIFGIGTSPNNKPGGRVPLFADPSGNFTTQVGQESYSRSLFDSGSNAIYFPKREGIDLCSNQALGFFCPSHPRMLWATLISPINQKKRRVSFRVSKAEQFPPSDEENFDSISGVYSDGFIWGIPFFIGRRVYFGIDQRPSPLGVGPWVTF